jgi:NitT/TauT family transport system permease protein
MDDAVATERSRPSLGTRSEPAALRLASVVCLLALWWIVSRWVGEDIIPGPAAVWERFVHVILHEDFALNLTATLARVLIGLALSLTVATMLGIAMGLNTSLERFFDGLVLGGRTMPGLAWALLALMVIGVSGRAPILAVVLAVSPLLTLQIWEGTKALDRDLFEMSRVFGVGRFRQLRQVIIPAILPSIVGGAKLGLALSWKVTVLAELFGVTSGVGYEINRNFQMFSLDGVLAWALSFALVMAIIEYGLIAPVYSWLTRWRRSGEHVPRIGRLLRQSAWFKRVSDTRDPKRELQ